MGDSYAVLMVNGLPDSLFPDMDAACEYVERHTRLNAENASIIWPIREKSADLLPPEFDSLNDTLDEVRDDG